MAEISKWKRKKKDSINDKQWLKSTKSQENKRKVIDFSDRCKGTVILIKQGIYLSRKAGNLYDELYVKTLFSSGRL